jgi:hypothetical protein
MAEVNHCDECHHEWMGDPNAKRCPTRECRSVKWNASVKTNQKPSVVAATMPSLGPRLPVVQPPESKHSQVWAPGTSRKTQTDFLAKYGREPSNRAEADLYAKRGW